MVFLKREKQIPSLKASFNKKEEAGCFKKEGGTAATVPSPLIYET